MYRFGVRGLTVVVERLYRFGPWKVIAIGMGKAAGNFCTKYGMTLTRVIWRLTFGGVLSLTCFLIKEDGLFWSGQD